MMLAAAQQAQKALDAVVQIRRELLELPGRVDRRRHVGPLRAAEEALSTLTACELDDPEHPAAVKRAQKGLQRARQSLDSFDAQDPTRAMAERLRNLERTLDEVREAIEEISADEEPEDALPAPQGMTASRGVPHHHAFARQPLRVRFDDPDARDQPTAGKRLRVLNHRAPATGLAAERIHVKRLARDCLEEIGAVGNLRRVDDAEPFDWHALQRFDQRLLNDLDALVALASPSFMEAGRNAQFRFEMLQETLAYSHDGPTIDPGLDIGMSVARLWRTTTH